MGIRPTNRNENSILAAYAYDWVGEERQEPDTLSIGRGRLGVWRGMRV